MTYNQGECPICPAPDGDADESFSNHYEHNGLLWERVIITRRCGHQQVFDYPAGISLSADARLESNPPTTAIERNFDGQGI